VTRALVELLWRHHPEADTSGTRGPRARHSTDDVVVRAMALADEDGLDALTIRALARSLEVAPMSVYTHVNSRDDLLVLMVDEAHARMRLPDYGRSRWRTRVQRVAEANLAVLRAHPWLLDCEDQRTALGPGTIAKYDHELHAFDGTGLGDVERDAALSFVLDFTRASGRALLRGPGDDDFGPVWASAADRLGRFVGDDFELGRRVGQAAGEQMGAPYRADLAWDFGVPRVLAGLSDLIDT
jgi:AcrR family transcriptional regulator